MLGAVAGNGQSRCCLSAVFRFFWYQDIVAHRCNCVSRKSVFRFIYTRDFKMENGGNIPSYQMSNVTRYMKMITYIHKMIKFMLLLV